MWVLDKIFSMIAAVTYEKNHNITEIQSMYAMNMS